MSPALLQEFARWSAGMGYADQSTKVRVRILRSLADQLGDVTTVTTAGLAGVLGCPRWSTWTRVTYRAALRSFFGFLVAAGYRADDPGAGLRSPAMPVSVPNPVTLEELATALAASEGTPWYAVLVLAAYAGLRAGEIAALDVGDVTQTWVTVWFSKGQRSRRIPTHPLVWALVDGKPSGPVAPTVTGRRFDTYLSSHIRKHFDAIGLLDVHLHRFRAWFATEVQRAVRDIRVTQELLGHKSVQTTMAYTFVDPSSKVAAVAALPLAS